MSGSGSNAFLDFLAKLAPSSAPEWALVLAAALISAAVGLALVRFNALVCRRLERRVGAAENLRAAPAAALAGLFGALAAYPFAPHVFFADIAIGLLLIVALLSATALGDARRAAWQIPLVLALLVPVTIGGTLNLIEASRLQADWLGLGWLVFKNPFALAALCLFALSALEATRSEQHVALFIFSAVAAVFFLGGFESPLTWFMRKSLGEDPGFVNHVTLADGSIQTRIAIGGLVFQLVCAATLIAKTMLGIFVMMRLRAASKRGFLERTLKLQTIQLSALALCCVAGAGSWEWARAALFGGASGA